MHTPIESPPLKGRLFFGLRWDIERRSNKMSFYIIGKEMANANIEREREREIILY